MSYKIATWNVNSLRVRLSHVLTWLNEMQPDVLALQETKLLDADFPCAAIQEAGYIAYYSGQKTYNGVALLIKQKSPLQNVSNVITDITDLMDPQRRILGLTIDDLFVLNVYVPNGESLTSEKYHYKLHWLQKLNAYLITALKKNPKMIVLGDFNIAPEEIDVHDPVQWQNQVLFSPLERNALRDLMKLGFDDCFRRMNPSAQQYTWWDYRVNAFKRKMGLRIDHILASQHLVCKACHIDQAPRAWERPSDHAPVIAEF